MQVRKAVASGTREQATSCSSATPDLSTSNKIPRTPKEENEIAISEFRPSVLPEDRISRWTSPYSISYHASLLSELPTLRLPAILDLLRNAFEKPTRIQYGTGLLRFHQFCDKNEISESARMPASMFLLAVSTALTVILMSCSIYY